MEAGWSGASMSTLTPNCVPAFQGEASICPELLNQSSAWRQEAGQHGQTYIMLPKYTSTLFISVIELRRPKRGRESKNGERLGSNFPST